MTGGYPVQAEQPQSVKVLSLCLGSHHAKFDDDDFNSFRRITCEGHTDTQRHTHTDFVVIYLNFCQSRKQP